MYEFNFAGVNRIASSTGHTIETLGRAGIRLGLEDGTIEVNSEMLHPPMSIMIYRESFPRTLSVPRDDLLDEVIQGLSWAGFTVEVV